MRDREDNRTVRGEFTMTESTKDQAESAFKKKQQERIREGNEARMRYEAGRRAEHDKTTRLRELRMAKEAADLKEATDRKEAKARAAQEGKAKKPSASRKKPTNTEATSSRNPSEET